MPQSKSTQRMERRASARTEANLSMRLMGAREATGLPEFVTESENISASGVYCFSPHYLAPLSKVGVTLVLPETAVEDLRDRLLKCEAVVVRCEQNRKPAAGRRYELACSFLGLDGERRRLLEEFVTLRNLKALRAPSAASQRRARAKAVRAVKSRARVAAKKKAARKPAPARAARTAARTAARAPRAAASGERRSGAPRARRTRATRAR